MAIDFGDSIGRFNRAVGHQKAVVQNREAVAQAGAATQVVASQQERASVVAKALQLVGQPIGGRRVESGELLVEQQQVGLVEQRARQGTALP